MIIKNLTSFMFRSFKILQSINAQTKTIILLLMPVLLVSILSIAIVNQTSLSAAQEQTPINNATTLADPNALINQGTALYQSERFNEAIQYFDKALAINPDDRVALDGKGAALYMSGRFNEAIQYFDKALAINPDDAYASNTKNLALSQLGIGNNTGGLNGNMTLTTNGGTSTPQPTPQQQQPQPTPQQQQPQPTPQQQQPQPTPQQQQPQPTPQQQQPQPIQQQQQPQPVIPSHEAVDSFIANGKINSDIITSTTQWTATGDWNMIVNDNELQLFTTNMTWTNATSGHTHEFLGFEAEDGEIVLPPDNIVSISGNMDVGTNRAISWEDVPATIDIGGGGKIITISLDHELTNHHFAGQAVRGVVTLLTPCSDTPGPSMEVLPSCPISADGGEGDEEEEEGEDVEEDVEVEGEDGEEEDA
jgi:Tetratricopeptide repeat